MSDQERMTAADLAPDERTIQRQLEVDELAPSLNGDSGMIRMHWSKYKEIRDRWIWKVREQGIPEEIYPARVHLLRRYAHHPLDLDNLYAAAKVPLDVLCKTGWLRDDDTNALVGLECTQEKVATKEDRCTVIQIKGKHG